MVISLVWVGFSAPLPRPPATFIFEGELPLEDNGSGAEDAWQKGKASEKFTVDHIQASNLNQWIRLRDPSKSVTYDHLGF